MTRPAVDPCGVRPRNPSEGLLGRPSRANLPTGTRMRWGWLMTITVIMAGVIVLLALLIGGFVAATWAPERSVAELQGRWAQPPSVFVDVAGMRVHLRDEGPREDPSP